MVKKLIEIVHWSKFFSNNLKNGILSFSRKFQIIKKFDTFFTYIQKYSFYIRDKLSRCKRKLSRFNPVLNERDKKMDRMFLVRADFHSTFFKEST